MPTPPLQPKVRHVARGDDRWLALMQVDKKAEGGEIRFVVIGPLGQAGMRPAPESVVRDVIAFHTR